MSVVGLAAPAAHATVGIQNHNNPAGDPAVTGYRIQGTRLTGDPWGPLDFPLVDNDSKSFGVMPGTYVIQSLPHAGWQVSDIKCVDNPPNPAAFQIDVANGRVTVNHATTNDEQWCAFTNSKVSASGAPPSPGVSPTPPPELIPPSSLPQVPSLIRVIGGRRFATATIRIPQRSTISSRLMWRRTRELGAKRVVHKAGTWTIKVPLRSKSVAMLRRRGMKRVTLTFRIAVAPDQGVQQTFRYGVIVRI